MLIQTYLFFYLAISITVQSYSPDENIALNCGSSGNSSDQDLRIWTGDISSIYIKSSQQNTSSTTATASSLDAAPQVPYATARIFHSSFTYSFQVSPGPKIIRLHFHPSSYPGLDISSAFFSVIINNNAYTLLHNFSALLTSRFLKQHYFEKEFCVIVPIQEQELRITFIPSPESKSSFAFINGIEIVSMPTDLYFKPRDVPIVGQSQPLFLDDQTNALETVYRLKVSGQAISPSGDSGIFRSWSQDISFIFGDFTGNDPYHFTLPIKHTKVPPYTAPDTLYFTARDMGPDGTWNENNNLTWLFPVDTGFYYLARLHFCEIAPRITSTGMRLFEIFLNNQTADEEMDIIYWAGGIGVPIYREFIVMVPQTEVIESKQNLSLALHPNTKSVYSDTLLSGIEIFKLNDSSGNLAGPNPNAADDNTESNSDSPASQRPMHSNKNHKAVIVAPVIAGSIVMFIACALALLAMWRSQWKIPGKRVKTWAWSPSSKLSLLSSAKASSLPTGLCRHFSLAEIKSATDNFSISLLVGVGGFGNVYKGYIDDGTNTVAIKRLNPSSQQGVHEFLTEIEMLSQLRHVHLVSLIGYCGENHEMILVYDYMARGTLRDHLYNTENPPLPWKLRLQICIGAARGLQYLHSGAKHMIIHRDVKTTNILLDEKWAAKVSDFGLSRMGPTDVSRTHVSTAVKGTFGYLDPEYYRRQQLTEKSDVYSFGVVLFEVLCARPPLDKSLVRHEMCLSEWAKSCYRNGILDQIIDPFLVGKIAPECLKKYGEMADRCLHDKGIERPSMADVVWTLEFALQLQEKAEESKTHFETGGKDTAFCGSWVCEKSESDEIPSRSTDDSAQVMSQAVFSELVMPPNAEGR
ncbi:Malectin-like domain [Dillenia turbinata]|uniref:Malectin-like domain n=1 Tax=Dillenia turbinata TaxID=194707 RepID=A0AAN8UTT7_9MAGN